MLLTAFGGEDLLTFLFFLLVDELEVEPVPALSSTREHRTLYDGSLVELDRIAARLNGHIKSAVHEPAFALLILVLETLHFGLFELLCPLSGGYHQRRHLGRFAQLCLSLVDHYFQMSLFLTSDLLQEYFLL